MLQCIATCIATCKKSCLMSLDYAGLTTDPKDLEDFLGE